MWRDAGKGRERDEEKRKSTRKNPVFLLESFPGKVHVNTKCKGRKGKEERKGQEKSEGSRFGVGFSGFGSDSDLGWKLFRV